MQEVVVYSMHVRMKYILHIVDEYVYRITAG
jgi:hypothetical protein